MRRSSLVTAVASSNQPAVNSKSTGVKLPVDKHVSEVIVLF
ncbi:hypothetical protein SAMN02799630_03931 [Paenibacillus sp. UNCCL117]|nr:hypothetical protein SAMN04488602_1104 [Paenibacillus sp. cl123]SFW51645.1 hypothetical protein SAMN02799630_03931 [Paenibacillus sp. UNCCL117]